MTYKYISALFLHWHWVLQTHCSISPGKVSRVPLQAPFSLGPFFPLSGCQLRPWQVDVCTSSTAMAAAAYAFGRGMWDAPVGMQVGRNLSV